VIFANRLAVNTFNSDIAKIMSFLNLVIFSRGIFREKVTQVASLAQVLLLKLALW
jgi:hypothetical protein